MEANTFEKLEIKNVNEKTAEIAEAVGEYLKESWGVIRLSLKVDEKEYSAESDEEMEALKDIFDSIPKAKDIEMSLRSCMKYGLVARMENDFIRLFAMDDEIRENVTYRSTDYYDTDVYVDLYRFDQNGESRFDTYTDSKESVWDIKRWYSYTPDCRISVEKKDADKLSYAFLQDAFKRICELTGREDFEDAVTDDWDEYGEIILEPGMSIEASKVPELITVLQDIADAVTPVETAEFKLFINGIPDGEDDYDFAGIRITLMDGKVAEEYCRF